MSIQDEAGLILRLYELRREATMRQAREWYFREFHPQSLEDFSKELFSEHSGHLRMVITYWDLAATLVNHGAIGVEVFTDANTEHIGVFAKIEPILNEMRGMYAPEFVRNLEKLIDATPNGRKRSAEARERLRAAVARLAAQAQQS